MNLESVVGWTLAIILVPTVVVLTLFCVALLWYGMAVAVYCTVTGNVTGVCG